jgi:hypothetical protein
VDYFHRAIGAALIRGAGRMSPPNFGPAFNEILSGVGSNFSQMLDTNPT